MISSVDYVLQYLQNVGEVLTGMAVSCKNIIVGYTGLRVFPFRVSEHFTACRITKYSIGPIYDLDCLVLERSGVCPASGKGLKTSHIRRAMRIAIR
jgi:hypothetical protein